MSHATYTDLRQNLTRYMDETIASRDPIIITRSGGKGNVVMMSEEEFNGWQETVHLLRSPANAARLLRSIQSANAGEMTEHSLIQAPPSPKP